MIVKINEMVKGLTTEEARKLTKWTIKAAAAKAKFEGEQRAKQLRSKRDKLVKEKEAALKELTEARRKHAEFMADRDNFANSHPETIEVIKVISTHTNTIKKSTEVVKLCKSSLKIHIREKKKEFDKNNTNNNKNKIKALIRRINDIDRSMYHLKSTRR